MATHCCRVWVKGERLALQVVLQVLGVVGVLGSLIGIPLSYHYGRRSRRKPVLRYVVDHDVVLDAERLFGRRDAITFDKKSVASLSRTTLAVWNAVGDTIKYSDSVVPSDRWRMSFPSGTQVLAVRPLSWSRDACDIKVFSEGAEVFVAFDFLDEGDGVVVEVIHDSRHVGDISGTGRGVTLGRIVQGGSLTPASLERVGLSPYQRLPSVFKKLLLYGFALPLAVLTVTYLFAAVGILDVFFEPDNGGRFADLRTELRFWLILTGMYAYAAGFYFVLTRLLMRSLIPRSLVARRNFSPDEPASEPTEAS